MLVAPVHAPDQPPKVEPTAGETVRVTVLFWLKLPVQVVPQSIPAGALVIVPLPVPVLLTVNAICVMTKFALTDWAWLSVTAQVLVVPVQAPDQPLKLDPAAGVAVRVMAVFGAKLAVQVAPQSMPAGVLVIDPVPVPLVVMVNAKGIRVKLAVTV